MKAVAARRLQPVRWLQSVTIASGTMVAVAKGIMSTTQDALEHDEQFRRWNALYDDHTYFYGEEAGPVARRAVRYHRPLAAAHKTALDVGCGEGQDLTFLAACGYRATGLDFTVHGVAKTQRLLKEHGQQAEVVQADLRHYEFPTAYDLVIAVNSLQFLGESADGCLQHVAGAVAPGGVLGLSLFAQEEGPAAVRSGIFFVSLSELLQRFREGRYGRWKMLEAAQVWQWSHATEQPQMFSTLIAQRLEA